MEKQYQELNKMISSIETLLKQSVVIELAKNSVGQVEIGKRLGVATGTVNKWVKGIKKDTAKNDNGKR